MVNTLRNLLQNVKMFKLSSGRGDGVLGIDIGTQAVKIVQIADRKGRAHLIKYGSIALGPYQGGEVGQAATLNPDQLTTVISTLLSEAGMASETGLMSIPLRSSLLRVIEIPRVKSSKIREVVSLEARKYIPVQTAEVTLTWLVVPEKESEVAKQEKERDEEGTSKEKREKVDDAKGDNKEKVEEGSTKDNVRVLIVAIHNNIINDYRELADRIGLTSFEFETEVFSMMRSVLGQDKSTVAIVDIGAANTKLVVIDDGTVHTSHSIPAGSQDMTQAVASANQLSFSEAEKLKRKHGLSGAYEQRNVGESIQPIVERIFSEVKNAIENFERNEDLLVENVILLGGGALLSGIVEVANKLLGKKVVLGDPFSKVESPVAILEPILKEVGPEFAVAVGLALRGLEY